MKVTTSDVSMGMILEVDWGLFKVVDMTHTHTWRGWATDTFKVKEITTWKTKQITYHSGTTLEQANVKTNAAVFLYNAGESYSFMENDTGEIFELERDAIEDIEWYLKESLDCYLMKYDGNVISVILPNTISYTITSTVPWIKGNRANSWTKPAIIETGMEIQVPLHKSEGDVVTVNTLTGKVN